MSFAAKDGKALYSQIRKNKTKQNKTKLGAECGSDNELPFAKFRLQLNKVGKTTKPLVYDLNQIPYNVSVGGTHSFKGLDLIDGVPEELQAELHDFV